MRTITFILLLCVLALGGCKTTSDKEKAKKDALKKKAKAELREDNDIDFQAFIGRLRKAVAAKDIKTLGEMMTPDFGYKLSPEAMGSGVFKYWDDNNLWPELDGILSEKFVKKGNYMVAPPQFADESLNYDGYRAGIRRINGSWKFVYFVNG
jgi:hypothetical protein